MTMDSLRSLAAAIVRMRAEGMSDEAIDAQFDAEAAADGHRWLRTDEVDELIRSLEHTAFLATKLPEDLSWWKWVIIALHNSVQGACVCAIRGKDTTGVMVLDGSIDDAKSCMAKNLQWLNTDFRSADKVNAPKKKLASMMELYRRISNSEGILRDDSFPAHADITRDLTLLNDLRNRFIHFVPMGWSLEVSGMPRIVNSACNVIEHLAVKKPSFWHRIEEDKPRRVMTAIYNLRQAVERWK